MDATAMPLGLPPLTRADGSAARVLVVDDEAAIAAAIGDALRADGWEARTETRGRDALIAVREFLPDLILLDIMMPGIDGFETLERVRAIRPDMRVLFLTALDGYDDRVAGLRAGGDDYLPKPFDVAELQARARALARTAPTIVQPRAAVVRAAGLAIDQAARSATLDAAELELTPTEFELLLLFANNPDRVLGKPRILEAVWGYDFGSDSNLVEVYVGSLRRKLAAGGSVRLETVRRVGYVLRTGGSGGAGPSGDGDGGGQNAGGAG